MEVHHSHHPTHKKKWTEYLLEFFMLFLAVFLGFVAENIREKSVERHREKEYIVSLIQDLKTDTANLTRVIRLYKKQHKNQDTLLMLFDSLDLGFNKNFVRLLGSIEGFPDFIYTDATIQQLKSSGGFRLIRNKKAVDSINAYTSAVSRTYINTNDLGTFLHEMNSFNFDFFNYRAMSKAFRNGMSFDEMQAARIDILISHDKVIQEKFFGKIAQMQMLMSTVLQSNFIPLKAQAGRLIIFLKKEYHLENK
ncbi:MAG TPA: hypothetical protein VK483_03765 [Chitinophagaceae bacterium]|nr:hypothetical protein [Chitinophagaceae bacterium]